MEIYLVRHGETVWNREGKYYGHSDISLSEEGYRQAKTVGDSLKKIKFDAVYSSPLKRALLTADEIVDETALPDIVQTDSRLMEQNFGRFEGKTYGELKKEAPEELAAWNEDWQNYVLPEGESFVQVRKRVDSFADFLWQLASEGKKKRILITAHKGTFGHLLPSLLSMPLSGYWNFVFTQGTYSRIDLEDGYAIIRSLNATEKLE
jgi:alpha-ribazole phosphatase